MRDVCATNRFVRLLAVLARSLLWVILVAAGPASAQAEFLDPSVAYQFSAQLQDGKTAEVHYQIADGYYLYRDRFKFTTDSGSVTLGPPIFPKGELKYDPTFNKTVEEYRKEVTIRVPLQGNGPFTLVSTSQGCADAGLCYPPQQARARLDLTPAAGKPGTVDQAVTPKPFISGIESSAQMSRIQEALRGGNLAWIAVLFVGFGIALAFTPCVLPMLPILSSIIAGDADSDEDGDTAERPRRPVLDRARGFALALAYSLGMALVYTALGIAAGLAGEGLAAALQTPIILWCFAVILLLLALSMFGFYQLQIPRTIQARLTHWCGRAAGGRLAGVFIMGALSALIVGPCVAAPLAGTLLYISETRNGWIGGTALFSMALGMSVPLLVLGVSEGALLPRAGAWMESVKKSFGALLIAVAIWMVSPVVPSWAEMLAWGSLLIISSVYLHVFDPLPAHASGWGKLWKGVGVLLLLAGAAQILGVATGSRDILQPLNQLVPAQRVGGSGPLTTRLPFERVHSSAELDARLRSSTKPVMLSFTAQWCVSCKEMDRLTFSDARVSKRLSDFVLLEADVTDNNADDRALLRRFGLFGPPGFLFFGPGGQPIPAATIVGYEDADTFLRNLTKITS